MEWNSKINWEDNLELPTDEEITLRNQELDASFRRTNTMKIKNPSEYVVPKLDIQDGEYIIIKNEGEYHELPQDKSREVLTFRVELPNGSVKKMSVNATSQKELILAWTDDSKLWIGKRCLVQIVNQKVFNEFKDVIYLHPEGKASPVVPEEEIVDNEDEDGPEPDQEE